MRDQEVKEDQILNISCKHYIMIRVELKYLIGSGYFRIFDRVSQAIQKIEALGCQPMKILLSGTYHKSTNQNASSCQTKCIICYSYKHTECVFSDSCWLEFCG